MTIKPHTLPISRTQTFVLALAAMIIVGVSARAQAVAPSSSLQPPLMDREKEIALALSACPARVASSAISRKRRHFLRPTAPA